MIVINLTDRKLTNNCECDIEVYSKTEAIEHFERYGCSEKIYFYFNKKSKNETKEILKWLIKMDKNTDKTFIPYNTEIYFNTDSIEIENKIKSFFNKYIEKRILEYSK